MADLLTTREVADFVGSGRLVLPGVVPPDLNEQALAAGRSAFTNQLPPGVPAAEAFGPSDISAAFLRVPEVAGALRSLLGPDPILDHRNAFVLFPRERLRSLGVAQPPAQGWHQDVSINTRLGFDVHVMWYPQAVDAAMGATRVLPGSHLRTVSEYAISRTQNFVGQEQIVGPAGTVALLHHGLWHGAGQNRASLERLAIKYRLSASGSQCRQWDTSDLEELIAREKRRPAFAPLRHEDGIHHLLFAAFDWIEDDALRLDYINRVRLWRYLTGDSAADPGHWLQRLRLDDPRWVHRA